MHKIRLIKGRSYYDGTITATKEKPDVFVDGAETAGHYVATGFFKYMGEEKASAAEMTADADDLLDEDLFTDTADTPDESSASKELETKSVKELKAYAANAGVDISGLTKKEDIISKIAEEQEKASAARAALRGE